ncbi:MAG: universal stress protein, partial [Acidimicrobiia bacterium]|nr:universal stress protein [Acidimicrobiia bacterium]
PGAVLAHFGAKNGFDMIAMSTRGLSGFKRLVIGSIARQVVDSAEVPVLLYPPR